MLALWRLFLSSQAHFWWLIFPFMGAIGRRPVRGDHRGQ